MEAIQTVDYFDISTLFELPKAIIETLFDDLKVLYTLFNFILGTPMDEFEIWMPSLFFAIMSLSLALIIVLRIIGR